MQRGEYSKTGASIGCPLYLRSCTLHSQYSKAAIPEPVLTLPCPRDPSPNSTALVLYCTSPPSPDARLRLFNQTSSKFFAPSHHRVPVQVYTRTQARPCPPLRCLPSTCPPPHAPAYALPRVLPRLRTGRRPRMRHDGTSSAAACATCRHLAWPPLASVDRRCGAPASEYRECFKRAGWAILWP